MLKAIFLGSVLSALIALSSTADLRFWTGNCNGAHEQCGNVGTAFCCIVARPFCTSVNCVGCANGNDFYTYNKKSCTGHSFHSCREPGCCNPAGSGNGCAADYFRGAARKRTVYMANATPKGNITMTPEEEQNCKKSVKPNKMTFYDAEGKEHCIHMPAYRYEEAHEYFIKEKWEELKQFPKWADQKYEDHEIITKE